MTRSVRRIQMGLLALVVVVIAATVWSLRRPASSGPRAAAPGLDGRTTRMADWHHEWLSPSGKRVRLDAKTMLGVEGEEMKLTGVRLAFPYTVQGKVENSTVTSDQGVFTPADGKALFQGHVQVRTDEGLELDTESLLYEGTDGSEGRASTEAPFVFKRKGVSGSATGLTQDPAAGRLTFHADVKVRIQDDPEDVPVDIVSRRAVTDRQEQTIRFIDAVEVVQGPDLLTCAELIVNFSDDGNGIQRAQAVGGIHLRTSSGRGLTGKAEGDAGGGVRDLRSERLDLWYRPDRTLERAEAGPDGELVLEPGPGALPEARRIKSRFLFFFFDEQGRFTEVQGRKDTTFSTEPRPPSTRPARTGACQNLVARFHPETGDMTYGEFIKDVVFTLGDRRITSNRAWYESEKDLLILKEDPEIADAKSRLSAQAIDVTMGTGNLTARQKVRHVVQGEPGGGGLLRPAETLLTSRFFDYDAATRTGRYREGALLRSGTDEVRADDLRVQEQEGGARRLTARGSVVSLMTPQSKPGEPAATTIEGRAREMIYDPQARRIDYTRDVVLLQGDIRTRSPKATLHLSADGGGVDRLEAGEPVVVEEGSRRGSGTRGVYTPADRTMVLTGPNVTLTEPGRTVQGRSVTFRAGDEKVLVDGREQVRTETVFKGDAEAPPAKGAPATPAGAGPGAGKVPERRSPQP